jgi:hypothetical protein
MPPLELNDSEMSMLLTLSARIDPVRRLARQIQRKYWDPPQLPTQARWRAPKGRSSNLEHYGDAAIIALSSVLAFSHRQRRSPTKARWVAGMRCC